MAFLVLNWCQKKLTECVAKLWTTQNSTMSEAPISMKRVASESAEGDHTEKKQLSETFPDTIFEEEAQRLLDQEVKEWRRKKPVQDIVDKIKEILESRAAAEKIDAVRFENRNRVYLSTIRLEALFDDLPVCSNTEPMRVSSWDVKEAVSARLLRAIDPKNNDRVCFNQADDDIAVCRQYLRESWFASTKRPKDRPNLKVAQEEARKKGLPKLAVLLGKLPGLWKQFNEKHYGKKEKKSKEQEQSDSDDDA